MVRSYESESKKVYEKLAQKQNLSIVSHATAHTGSHATEYQKAAKQVVDRGFNTLVAYGVGELFVVGAECHVSSDYAGHRIRRERQAEPGFGDERAIARLPPKKWPRRVCLEGFCLEKRLRPLP